MTELSALVDDLDKLSKEGLQHRYREIVEIVRDLEGLQAHPGWAVLCELLEANARNVQNELISTSDFSDLGDAFRDQRQKALIRGLRRVKPLLTESIGYYRGFRDNLAEVLERGTRYGTTEPDSADGDPAPGGIPSDSFAP